MQPSPASQDRARIVSDRRMTNFYVAMMSSAKPAHIYEVRPQGQTRRRSDLRCAALRAIGYAKFFSRSLDAVIRVYDKAGNVIETHEHAGEFKEW
jgi:hypothetical protein